MSLGKGLESLIPKKPQRSAGSDDAKNHASATDPETSEERPTTPEEEKAQRNGSLISSTQISVPTPAPEAPRTPPSSSPPSSTPPSHRERVIVNDAVFHIELDKIAPNPHQPRTHFDEESLKELAASIREFGVLQPLVVSKIERETDSGTEVAYELIAGERRLLAARLAGLERVPVIIRRIAARSEKLEMAIVENLQRSDLNPIETARAYAKLQDEFGLTQREVATRLGKSREAVANTLRLLNLPTFIQDAVAKEEINESQARLLLTIPDAREQEMILHDLVHRNMSVRELRERIKKETRPVPATAPRRADPEVDALEERLAELLGAKVKIEKTGEAGKIIITFYSPEEIQGIIQKLEPDA